jgi:S-(hydroxymethyl)glutathione dehydrogenase/alcohol dehydrogenase
MLVHEHALAKIDDDMPLSVAALLGCAVVTGLGAVLRTAKVENSASVAVIGAGGIGLAAIQGARLANATPVIAIDVVPEKLELATGLGASHVINAAQDDPVAAVREITSGGVDYSFEAIGSSETARQAFLMLGPAGVATVIGMIPQDVDVAVPGVDLWLSEKRLQGSFMGSNRFRVDLPRYCQLYLDGRLNLDDMVTSHRPLEQINEGYAAMRLGEGTRTLIDFPP